MASRIDPSLAGALDEDKDVDKQVLKKTLKAAKQEIEELQSSVMHLQRLVEEQETAIGIITVEDAALAAGADPVVGDGVVNDGPSLQAAIEYAENNSLTLYWPKASYRTSASLLIGTASNVWTRWTGTGKTNINGSVAGPLVRTAGTGIEVTYDDTSKLWVVDPTARSSNGCRVFWNGMTFENSHQWGSAVQFYNIWMRSIIMNCGASAKMGCWLLLQAFDVAMIGCRAEGRYFASPNAGTLADDHWKQSYGFYLSSHTTLVACSAVGCGVGIQTTGVEIDIHARLEVNGIGLRGGLGAAAETEILLGRGLLGPDAFGSNASWESSRASLSFESNYYGLMARQILASVALQAKFQGFTGAAPTGATPQSAIAGTRFSYLNIPGQLNLSGDWAVSAIQSIGEGPPFMNAGAGWYPRDVGSATDLPQAPGTGLRYTGTTPGTLFGVGADKGAGHRGFVEQGTGAGTVGINPTGYTTKFGGSGVLTTNIGDRVWIEMYQDGEVGIWVESRG